MEESRRETITRLEQLMAQALAAVADGSYTRMRWHEGRAYLIGKPEDVARFEQLAAECGRIVASMPEMRAVIGDAMDELDDAQRWCKTLVKLGFA